MSEKNSSSPAIPATNQQNINIFQSDSFSDVLDNAGSWFPEPTINPSKSMMISHSSPPMNHLSEDLSCSQSRYLFDVVDQERDQQKIQGSLPCTSQENLMRTSRDSFFFNLQNGLGVEHFRPQNSSPSRFSQLYSASPVRSPRSRAAREIQESMITKRRINFQQQDLGPQKIQRC